MKNSLRYVGISHKTASISQREKFHISGHERDHWMKSIRSDYKDISGLLILVTCNRTEIYFESSITKARTIRDFIMGETSYGQNESLFNVSDDTQKTVEHLLNVSSGLSSTVLGDAEIIHQIKMAYRQSCRENLQGSLLERCMQTVFRGHKRISNETAFRDGTTSVAYKALKLISNTFNHEEIGSLKILCLGAGDIVKQLLNYNNKFGFKSVYVANRTAARAQDLTEKFGGHTYDWDLVLANDFWDFNVIISAVSNRPGLVNRVGNRNGDILLLDLAVPGNINKGLSELDHIVYYDLDTIAKTLKENHDNRIKSINQVNAIIQEELQDYVSWLNDAPVRRLLAEYKSEVSQWVDQYLDHKGAQLAEDVRKTATDRIVRKSVEKMGTKIPEWQMESMLLEHM